jgi:hypothetical protein
MYSRYLYAGWWCFIKYTTSNAFTCFFIVSLFPKQCQAAPELRSPLTQYHYYESKTVIFFRGAFFSVSRQTKSGGNDSLFSRGAMSYNFTMTILPGAMRYNFTMTILPGAMRYNFTMTILPGAKQPCWGGWVVRQDNNFYSVSVVVYEFFGQCVCL